MVVAGGIGGLLWTIAWSLISLRWPLRSISPIICFYGLGSDIRGCFMIFHVGVMV